MKSAWLIISSLLLVSLGFLAGRVAVPSQVEYRTIVQNVPQIETKYVYVDKPPMIKEVIIEIPVVEEVIREVVKIKWVTPPVDLKPFASEQAMKDWLVSVPNEVIAYVGDEGLYGCFDTAWLVVHKAWEQG